MQEFDQGLRCQDVHAGLRNVDPNSGALVPLADTQHVGMAASLAALIRGLDVIPDAQSLRAVAAEQLDVSAHAFNEVVQTLEEVEFIRGAKREGQKVVSFTENVPYYDDLYAHLGEIWRDRKPTELEQQMVLAVDRLALGPVPLADLADVAGLDSSETDGIVSLGDQSQLIRTITVSGEMVAYSPFFGFENPTLLKELMLDHGPGLLADSFAAISNEQGLAVDAATYPLLVEAIGRGLIAAPSVERPDGTLQPFATLPYMLDPAMTKSKKPILDKAMAVVACLRCAQRFGGVTHLPLDGLVSTIDKLLDPNRGYIAPHSGHTRQYRLMYNAGLISFGPDTVPGGRWVTPRFVDTPDNREALLLARDLLTQGHQIENRGGVNNARLLLQESPYSAPMQTIDRVRKKAVMSTTDWQAVVDGAMGRTIK